MHKNNPFSESTGAFSYLNGIGRNCEENNLPVEMLERIPGYAAFTLDRTGRVLSWNMGAERLTGHSSEEMNDQHFSYLFRPIEAKTLPDFELAIAYRRKFYEKEHWLMKKNGSKFWARMYIYPVILDNFTHTDGFVVMVWDLTYMRKNESIKSALLSPLDDY